MGGASVKIDLKGVEKKVSPENFAKGKLAIANQMLKDMSSFIPRDSGELSGSGQVTSNGVKYPGPYARAQFYGSSYNKNRRFVFKKYTTPGTGKRWDKKASALYSKNWAEVGAKAMGVK